MAENASLLHKFEKSGHAKKDGSIFLYVLIALILGLGTGYILAQSKTNPGNSPKITKSGDVTTVSKGDVFGSEDTQTFKDTAEGVVAKGGIDGEGQFHLVRPGGESQYVYMVSSIVDLSKFEKRKVKVWGQTQKAQKAGWLMDVGKLEVLE